MSFKVVIPARYASTRLPAKALLEIAGRPMIQWVIEAALRSAADEVLVATDDPRIAQAALHPGLYPGLYPGRPQRNFAVLTSAHHQSGTDRIAEVVALRAWSPETIVVNVQGDEPQLPPVLIDQVASLLNEQPRAQMATLSAPITSLPEFLDPNVVKVVTDRDGFALYFSRAPIPWKRDSDAAGQAGFGGAQRHLGIYAYRVAGLNRLTALPPSDLERIEQLEQLRALQAGIPVVVAAALAQPGRGVDTEDDLARVRALLADR